DILLRFNLMPVTDVKDNSFSVTAPGMIEIQARFVNGYMYFSPSKDAVAKDNLLKPADVFAAKETSSLVLRTRMDALPNELKKQVAAEFEKAGQQAAPTDSEAFKTFVKTFADSLKMLWTDAREMTLGLDFDRKSGDLAFVMENIPLPGTPLAKEYREAKPTV